MCVCVCVLCITNELVEVYKSNSISLNKFTVFWLWHDFDIFDLLFVLISHKKKREKQIQLPVLFASIKEMQTDQNSFVHTFFLYLNLNLKCFSAVWSTIIMCRSIETYSFVYSLHLFLSLPVLFSVTLSNSIALKLLTTQYR